MKFSDRKTKNLINAILALDTKDEARRFLRDLLTEKEIEEFSNRWEAAKMLNDKTPYSVIEKQTKLSSTTISRISKWLNSGMGGYKLMIDKSNHHHNSIPVGKGLR